MNEIFLIGDVGIDIKLKTIVDDLKEFEADKKATLLISTNGGNVLEGKAIYRYLVKLRKEGWEITTVGLGTIASMGTIIFLAGNKELRKLHDDDFFFLHLPENMVWGNSDDLEKEAENLRLLENEMAQIYADETDIDKEKALELMRKTDRVSAQELVSMGFAKTIVPKVTAKFNLNNSNMDGKQKTKIQSLLNALGSMFGNPQMKLVQDVNGVDIDFFELESDADVKVGDKAKVNDANADGEYIVVKDDKKYKYVFKDGVLDEITEVTDDGAGADAKDKEIQDLKNEIATLKQQMQDKENAQAQMKSKFDELQALIKTELGATGSRTRPAETGNPDERELQILK